MHNARIVQNADLKFDLLWSADDGTEHAMKDFPTADEAAAELARLQAEAAAPKANADAT